ncbi:MAG: AMP-dependent synthetase/ligase [Bacteroidota bacterium]
MSVAVSFSTIPELYVNIATKFGGQDRPIMMHKVNGKYVGIGYSELMSNVFQFAFGLASLGVQKGDRVAIISENRPEWGVSDLAIVSLGAIDVPVYPTMTAKQTEFIFNDAKVSVAIVSNSSQLNKVIKILPDVPSLKHVIVMNDRGLTSEVGAIGFNKVMEMGTEFKQKHPEHLSEAMKMVRPDNLLTFIYTSGTTGNPKGVMLTHANLVSNIIDAARVIEIQVGDRLLSFLPLCHSFERMAGYYTAMACGATIAYAESVETVRDNMLEVQPHIITTVPRLFERIHSRIIKQVDTLPSFRKKIFYWGMETGREYQMAHRRKEVSLALKLKNALADKLVFSKLRARTGGKMKFFISGGAALPREFGEFFEAAGLKIIEGYGLTETSPVLTVNRLDNYKFGSVGHPIPNVEIKIAEDGEILARGPNIMQGYWNNTEATEEVIKNGWFHTGDIGVIDADGFVHITDRKKHLFVSSGGKNIAPQPIENRFLSNKYIEQFVLIGDRRMFLTALIVPDFDVLKEHAQAHRLSFTSNSDLIRLPEINALFDKDIQLLQKDLATFERVRKFVLLDKPFTIEDGELTPTQKVKRKVVEGKYANLIDGMYEGIS